MAGDVRIGTVNIGNMVVAPDVVEGMSDFIKEQVDAGVDPTELQEEGYTGAEVPDEAGAPEEPPTTEEQVEADEAIAKRVTEEMITADMRADSLHQLVKEVDRANSMRGFQTNHDHTPDDPRKVGKIRTDERVKAEGSLARACANCIFRNDCYLQENLERWLDVHPYKTGHKNQRRPGSAYVKKVETRLDFIKVIRQDPQAHCDPAKRK